MREVREPIPRVYCCVVIYSVAESRRTRGQSEAAGAQTHLQRHRQTTQLTVQHLTPPLQPSLGLQAHKPAGGAINGEAYSLDNTVAVESQAKIECYTSGCHVSVFLLFSTRFNHSVLFLFSLLGVCWHPFCYRTVSPAQQSSPTSAV